MDLSNPLATITPTLDARVLQVLAATTSWCTAAEVHRRMGRGSNEGVRKVLRRLADQGVVLVETPGRSQLFRLNRDHIAFVAIEALSFARQTLIDRMTTMIEEWALSPIYAGLFGSFARGTADSESDIDVLFVRPADIADAAEATWFAQFGEFQKAVGLWTGNPAQVVTVTPDRLRAMQLNDDPLFLSLRAENVRLYGSRLLDVMARIP